MAAKVTLASFGQELHGGAHDCNNPESDQSAAAVRLRTVQEAGSFQPSVYSAYAHDGRCAEGLRAEYNAAQCQALTTTPTGAKDRLHLPPQRALHYQT